MPMRTAARSSEFPIGTVTPAIGRDQCALSATTSWVRPLA
jgi:hypothetical protein